MQFADNYRYVGCYIDSENPALPRDNVLENQTSMTLFKCFNYCRSKSKRYAAIQAGYSCTCGDDGARYYVYGLASSDTQCNSPCTGNTLQMCGGKERNSVYDLWGM